MIIRSFRPIAAWPRRLFSQSSWTRTGFSFHGHLFFSKGFCGCDICRVEWIDRLHWVARLAAMVPGSGFWVLDACRQSAALHVPLLVSCVPIFTRTLQFGFPRLWNPSRQIVPWPGETATCELPIHVTSPRPAQRTLSGPSLDQLQPRGSCQKPMLRSLSVPIP